MRDQYGRITSSMDPAIVPFPSIIDDAGENVRYISFTYSENNPVCGIIRQQYVKRPMSVEDPCVRRLSYPSITSEFVFIDEEHFYEYMSFTESYTYGNWNDRESITDWVPVNDSWDFDPEALRDPYGRLLSARDPVVVPRPYMYEMTRNDDFDFVCYIRYMSDDADGKCGIIRIRHKNRGRGVMTTYTYEMPEYETEFLETTTYTYGKWEDRASITDWVPVNDSWSFDPKVMRDRYGRITSTRDKHILPIPYMVFSANIGSGRREFDTVEAPEVSFIRYMSDDADGKCGIIRFHGLDTRNVVLYDENCYQDFTYSYTYGKWVNPDDGWEAMENYRYVPLSECWSFDPKIMRDYYGRVSYVYDTNMIQPFPSLLRIFAFWERGWWMAPIPTSIDEAVLMTCASVDSITINDPGKKVPILRCHNDNIDFYYGPTRRYFYYAVAEMPKTYNDAMGDGDVRFVTVDKCWEYEDGVMRNQYGRVVYDSDPQIVPLPIWEEQGEHTITQRGDFYDPFFISYHIRAKYKDWGVPSGRQYYALKWELVDGYIYNNDYACPVVPISECWSIPDNIPYYDDDF